MTTDDYLVLVGYELRDLPWKTKRDLLSEIRGHLDELPDETNLLARLGKPEQYAADMRTAAGLERRRGVIAFLRARRLRNLILFVAVLTVAGLAIGALKWIDSYQPLAFGNSSQLPAGTHGVPGIEGESVDFHKGSPFVFGLEIRNAGRFTVRVLGVPYEPYLPWTARLMMSPRNYTGATGITEGAFHAFDLKPGQRVFLVLKGVFACHSGMSTGGALGVSDFPVRFRFLWRTVTAEIPLPENLAIVFPKGCPVPAKYR